MAERLSAAVHHLGQEAVIELAGDLDGAASEVLDAAWAQAADDATRRVVLDVARVAYINSTGIALIVEILGRARASRVSLAARGLSPHYRQIFEITRLADFIALEDSGPERAAAGRP